jgi:hypothetical protein
MLNFMQNLSMPDSIKTKQLLPDRFWIIEHNGSRIGTIQRHDVNQFIVTGSDSSVSTLTLEEIEEHFGLFKQTNLSDVQEDIVADKECYGYPTKHIPYNAVYDVQHKLPLYSKSKNSNNMYAAGYYCVKFPKGWVKGFCPKLSTIAHNEYKGPFKTVIEQRKVFSDVHKS